MRTFDKQKQICPVCKRLITVTRNGRGVFRRHMISKGVICDGSWTMPGVVRGNQMTVETGRGNPEKKALEELCQ